MTAVTSERPTPRQWLTIDGTNWAYYEHTMEQIGDGHLRVTYDRGRTSFFHSPQPINQLHARSRSRNAVAVAFFLKGK